MANVGRKTKEKKCECECGKSFNVANKRFMEVGLVVFLPKSCTT